MNNQNSSGKGNNINLTVSRSKNDRKRLIRKMILIISACVLAALLIVIFVSVFFVVRNIEIVGVKKEDEDKVLALCGVSYGDSIFGISGAFVENNLRDDFPYIKSVSVERDYPSSVVIIVKEEYTTFRFEMDGEFFLFNLNMKLIDKFSSEEALLAIREKSVKVIIPGVVSAIVPGYIGFSESVYSNHVAPVIKAVSGFRYIDSVKQIDFSDRYNIIIDYNGKVKIFFGDEENAEEKVRNIASVLSEYGENASGTIDATNSKRIVANLISE